MFKAKGGLRIKRYELLNVSLLSKWTWRILKKKNAI